jgi:hypothetical protein
MFRSILLAFFSLYLLSCSSGSWQTRSRESAGIAPKAEELKESIFQIYAARAYSWRGIFGVHPWVSWKIKDETSYTVAQVVGWRTRRGLSAVSVEQDLPDRHWFGSRPDLLFEVRGEAAEKIIANVKVLIERYPYPTTYRVWPGPNSNTFVDYLIRHTDEITVELPPHAVGKDWPVEYTLFSKSPTGTGFQFSFFGVLGLTMGVGDGVEVNLLGLNFGLDFWTPAIKLPMIGRLGFPDKPL